MQLTRVQGNTNYNQSFSGKFYMYNYHKNRWFEKSTTPLEDNILSNLLDRCSLKYYQCGFYNFYSQMEYKNLSEYIKLFPKKTKGINLPNLTKKSVTRVEYWNDPVGPRSSYAIFNQDFKIIHQFDKDEIRRISNL